MAKRTVEPLKKTFMQACSKEEKKEKKARHCSFLKNTFGTSACSLKMFMFSFFHKQITKRALDPFKSDVQKTLVGARPATASAAAAADSLARSIETAKLWEGEAPYPWNSKNPPHAANLKNKCLKVLNLSFVLCIAIACGRSVFATLLAADMC